LPGQWEGQFNMKLFEKIAIVGVGLIGGSLGLEIKKRRLAGEVIGFSRHRETLEIAIKKKVIDRSAFNLNALKEADLVILATPVGTIIKLASRISKILKSGCIISDVGSTKFSIVSRMEKLLPPGVYFVGGHPLAGLEKRGILNAREGLFKDFTCILTRTKKTHLPSLKKMKRFWQLLGANVHILAPRTHDEILSYVSHLPHISAFSLVNAVPAKYLKFSSGGFKDTTRIALSDEEIWRDIFITNKNEIIKSVEVFQDNIERFKCALKNGDGVRLLQFIKRARGKRKLI